MIYILDAETGEDYEEKNTTWHMKQLFKWIWAFLLHVQGKKCLWFGILKLALHLILCMERV